MSIRGVLLIRPIEMITVIIATLGYTRVSWGCIWIPDCITCLLGTYLVSMGMLVYIQSYSTLVVYDVYTCIGSCTWVVQIRGNLAPVLGRINRLRDNFSPSWKFQGQPAQPAGSRILRMILLTPYLRASSRGCLPGEDDERTDLGVYTSRVATKLSSVVQRSPALVWEIMIWKIMSILGIECLL